MKTNSSRINAAKPVGLQLAGTILLIFILGILETGMGGCATKSYPDPPLTLVENSVTKTVKVAAEGGWVPCPGECLKLAKPGWQQREIQGFSPSDYWMPYPYTDKDGAAWQAFSQRHIGHIIRSYPDKAAQDVGICPICNGTGWVRKDDPNVKK
jgi:hypothetical protein